ncbi:MAG: ATP-binding cassette domain-containing protein [Thermodesulfobacteriota bacterium]
MAEKKAYTSPSGNAGRPWLRLERANVRLGEAVVLRDLSWAVWPGEHVLVTGANAAGKSTFLRLCAGLVWPENPASRVYTLGGQTTTSPLPLRQASAWVAPGQQLAYQSRGAGVVVWEIVATGITGTPFLYQPLSVAHQQRVAHTLEAFGLQALAQRPWGELSQGQQWQALLARAMAGAPQVVFLDECTSGLDAASRQRFWDAVEAAVALGAEIVLSTPWPKQVPAWLERSVVLENGCLASGKSAGQAAFSAQAQETGLPYAEGQKGKSGRTLIRLDRARVRHAGRDLVGPISLELSQGCVWAVRGANGAGKTTLLRLLAGEAQPYAGQGREYPFLPASWTRIEREAWIQAVFASHGVDFYVQNASAGSVARLKLPQAQELWDRFALGAIHCRPFAQLSSGQQQKVLLTRALAGAPSVLVLDEPFTALDAAGRAVLHHMVAAHIARGAAVVYSAHTEADCFTQTTATLWLAQGQCVAWN